MMPRMVKRLCCELVKKEGSGRDKSVPDADDYRDAGSEEDAGVAGAGVDFGVGDAVFVGSLE